MQPTRLLDFIERQDMPFMLTLHAKGFLPESHPNYIGVLGRARRSDVQRFVDRADLIVAAGYDEIEINYEEWAGSKPIVHLSSQKTEPSEDLRLVVNAAGDMDSVIDGARPCCRSTTTTGSARARSARRDARREPAPRRPRSRPITCWTCCDARLGPDDVLAYDVGAHTHQIATQWRTDAPNSCISTNGWSSMGYGIPAAYAAKLVSPGRDRRRRGRRRLLPDDGG